MTIHPIGRTSNLAITLAITLAIAPSSFAQLPPPPTALTALAPLSPEASQTAHLLALDAPLHQLRTLQSQRSADTPATLAEVTARQQLSESIQATTLDVDSVLAELANEQSELSSLRTSLEARRDKTVGRLTTAALLTGSGAGTAVSATQFTTLSSSTQNLGDALGIGSGAASTLLSILAARAQNGPRGAVVRTPNMLAPLLGGSPVLNTSYPPEVLAYLHSVPAAEDPARGTRLEQLLTEWNQVARLNTIDSPVRQQQVAALTSSGNPDVKVSIDQLSDRIAMLGDVRGRVSLMKRDLATIMRSYTTP